MSTGRFEIVGLTRSWHGLQADVASLNLAGGHAGYGPMMPGTLTLPAPYAYRCPIRHCNDTCDCSCLEAGFEVIDQQSVGSLSAVISEPVLSPGGVIVPPPDYFHRLHTLCDARDMLLIIDEAQTGFGRLGSMFGFEVYGIIPDILSVSKTLGGGIPIAATLMTSAIEAGCYHKGFMHVTSHVSDPLPAAAGLVVIAVIEEERLVERAQQRGAYLLARLQDLQQRYEHIGDVRGKGLLVGMELVEDRVKKTPADTLAMAVSYGTGHSHTDWF
jgi:2,2-dialkylglycine decarboxylase (pyruvate)